MNIVPALGTNIKDCKDDVLEGKIWRVTSKIDGVRRLFYKTPTGRVTAWSRTGKQDLYLKHITDFLEAPWFPTNRVYDCELVDRNLYYSKKVPSFILRNTTSSKASTKSFDNKTDLIAICFDIFIPDGDIRNGHERHQELSELFANGTKDDAVIMVPCYGTIYGCEEDKIKSFMDKEIQENGEGLMLMDLNSIYIPGRTLNTIKVKRLEEFVGKVIGIEMARKGTKIEGGVAALICEVEGCTVPVRVGSGLDNKTRLELANDSFLLGKYVEIEAFSYTKSAKGIVSLSFPVFKCLQN